MSNAVYSTVLILASTLAGACVSDHDADPTEDAIDDSFLAAGGKGDAAGIAEGSPEAGGVLRVANELGAEDMPDDLSLSVRAADAIVTYRSGADALLGSSDDRVIDTLTTLDSIAWVGTNAFSAMLSYARAHSYIAVAGPWDESYCGADLAMTREQVAAKFTNGATQRRFLNFTWSVRKRRCTATGCSAWDTNGWLVDFRTQRSLVTRALNIRIAGAGEPSKADLSVRADSAGNPVADLVVSTVNRLEWADETFYGAPYWLRASFSGIAPGTALSEGDISISDQVDVRLGLKSSAPPSRIAGTLGNHCMRLTQTFSATDASGVTTTDEMVLFGRY